MNNLFTVLSSITLSEDTIAMIVTVLIALAGAIFGFGKTFSDIKYLGKRTDKIEEKLDAIDEKIDRKIEPINSKLETISDKLISFGIKNLPDNIDDLAVSHSPKQLSDIGKKVLADSKINTIIEPKFDEIVEKVRRMNPENSYQAQEAVFSVVYELLDDDGLKNAIEEGAFASGRTPHEVLFVGALNIRDRVMRTINMLPDEIDKHDPNIA